MSIKHHLQIEISFQTNSWQQWMNSSTQWTFLQLKSEFWISLVSVYSFVLVIGWICSEAWRIQLKVGKNQVSQLMLVKSKQVCSRVYGFLQGIFEPTQNVATLLFGPHELAMCRRNCSDFFGWLENFIFYLVNVSCLRHSFRTLYTTILWVIRTPGNVYLFCLTEMTMMEAQKRWNPNMCSTPTYRDCIRLVSIKNFLGILAFSSPHLSSLWDQIIWCKELLI